MTATADKAIKTMTAGSETLIPASSRVSLLVGEEHQIDPTYSDQRAWRWPTWLFMRWSSEACDRSSST